MGLRPDGGARLSLKVAVVHNFHRSAVPSGEDVVVEAEVAALTRAGLGVRLVALRNDEERGMVRAAVTTATGFGPSPLDALDGFVPDLIHVHNLFPHFGTRWVRHAPVPIVSTQHSYRPMCANGFLFRSGEICTLCLDGRRWSGVRYGCFHDSRVATIPLAVAGRRGPALDPVLAAAARVLVLSTRAYSIFRGAGVPSAKLVRDWHFVPDQFRPPYGDTGAERSGWLVVGRLTPEKGIDRLIERWPVGIPLRVAGDGPLAATIHEGARGKQVELLGQLDRGAVLDEMRRALGLVVPSLWYETFGLVYIEALAAGLPVLAFPPNVVADAVAEEGTGAVASWDDVDGAVRDAADRFPGLREHCRAAFERRYTETAFVQRRQRLYQELTDHGPAGSDVAN